MKKALKVIAVLAVLFFALLLVMGGESTTLKRQGFSKEEIQMIKSIKSRQAAVNKAVGKGTDFVSWGHLTEVLDEEGTLVGYSIDGTMSGAVPKRYFFTTDKELLWWTNVSPEANDEGITHLKGGE